MPLSGAINGLPAAKARGLSFRSKCLQGHASPGIHLRVPGGVPWGLYSMTSDDVSPRRTGPLRGLPG